MRKLCGGEGEKQRVRRRGVLYAKERHGLESLRERKSIEKMKQTR